MNPNVRRTVSSADLYRTDQVLVHGLDVQRSVQTRAKFFVDVEPHDEILVRRVTPRLPAEDDFFLPVLERLKPFDIRHLCWPISGISYGLCICIEAET